MLRVSRTNMGPIGDWWFTVDRYMLFGIVFLGLIGLFFSLAVSPVEASHLKTNQYFFLIKQTIFLFISISLMVTISILPKNFSRKISLVLFIMSLLGVLLTFCSPSIVTPTGFGTNYSIIFNNFMFDIHSRVSMANNCTCRFVNYGCNYLLLF